METCDVLVVGLGPAGGAAALAAASAGLRVIALERRKAIGHPVQCAECVPAAMGALVRRVGCAVQRVDAMCTALPSGEVEESAFRGIMIDRAKLDAGLARNAAEAGAEVLSGCRFEGLDAAGSRVRCRDAQGVREIAFRLLIAADGPFSPVAGALGLPTQSLAMARQITVPLLQPLASTQVYLSPDYPGGYGWLFPKGTIANLGVGVEKGSAPLLKGRLQALHRQMANDGRVGMEVLARTGGAIPVGGMRPKIVTGNVLFAGDAAGLTHPVTGAGIHSAIVSGEAAGKATVAWLRGEGGALDEYEFRMRELFGPSLGRALARRQELQGRECNDSALRRSWVAFPDYYQQDEVEA